MWMCPWDQMRTNSDGHTLSRVNNAQFNQRTGSHIVPLEAFEARRMSGLFAHTNFYIS